MNVTVRLTPKMLEILNNGHVVYDIPCSDFACPEKLAFWWRQLAGKSWMTPGLHNEVARMVCRRMGVQ